MTVDRLAVCEPAPEPQELGLEHLQLYTARDDTSRCGTDYIRFCAETRDEMRVGDVIEVLEPIRLLAHPLTGGFWPPWSPPA